MFSVVTPRIWVSPRSNSAEPWARGITSTSAASGRMSVVPRPSMRKPSVRIRLRTVDLFSERNASPISFSRPSNFGPSSVTRRSLMASWASSRSCLPAMDIVLSSSSPPRPSTAAEDVVLVRREGREV